MGVAEIRQLSALLQFRASLVSRAYHNHRSGATGTL